MLYFFCILFLILFTNALPLPSSNNINSTIIANSPTPLQLKRSSLKSKISVDYASFLSIMDHYNNKSAPVISSSTETNFVLFESEHTLTYKLPLTIGSSEQKMDIELDTGSYNLWVPIEQCNVNSEFIFENSKSSTFETLNEKYLISYGSGKKSQGEWATDKFSLGNGAYNIPTMKFGAVTSTTHSSGGVLGIGFVSDMDDSQNIKDSDANLPVKIFSNEYTSKVAYSIYLNTQNDQDGEILFGAIDKAKYTGDLVTLPILMIDDALKPTTRATAFFVSAERLSIEEIDFEINTSYPALFDTGTTLTMLPEEIYDTFMSSIGVKINDNVGYATQCGRVNKKFVEFGFSGINIKVPFSEILETLNDVNGTPVKDSDDNDLCRIALNKSSANEFILGDNFLRSAYVHYDLTNRVIKIAQARYTDVHDIAIV